MPFDNAAYQREWKRNNPDKVREYSKRSRERKVLTEEDKERKRNYDLLRAFGITIQQYEEILTTQRAGCAICGRPNADSRGHKLHVDHDHKTGEIRGLLCGFCNKNLIGRHTDPELFQRAAEYLSKDFTGLFVPKDAPKRRRKRRGPKNS